MSAFEEHLTAWRQSMQAAGIGPGPVRDELESHLRHKVADLMRAGLSEAEAHREAARALGCGHALQKEFVRARRAPCLGSPLLLKLCAGAAVVVGLKGLIFFPNNADFLAVGYFAAIGSLPEPVSGLLSMFYPLLFNFLLPIGGGAAALYYLKWPGRNAGKFLAAYWTAIAWLFACRVLYFVPFHPTLANELSTAFHPASSANALSRPDSTVPFWAVAAVSLSAGSFCWLWMRHLRQRSAPAFTHV